MVENVRVVYRKAKAFFTYGPEAIEPEATEQPLVRTCESLFQTCH